MTMKITGKYTTFPVYANIVEDEALNQLQTIADSVIFKDTKIAVMPDVHAGKGCTIGFTQKIVDTVVPNFVGVDIGCGVQAAKIVGLHKDDITADELKKLDQVIRRCVPCGHEIHSSNIYGRADSLYQLIADYDMDYARKSLGTLGGGNHYIELNYNNKGEIYLVVHSGSRHLGVEVANYWQRIADKHHRYCNELKEQLILMLKEMGREKEISEFLTQFNKLNNDHISFLKGDDKDGYLNDMKIVQDFAVFNRAFIIKAICEHMDWECYTEFSSIHNYIDSTGILRKGAISANYGEMCLIPMNMRDGTLICRGKGNPDWNYSAPHGAGRLMSRAAAKKQLSLDDYKNEMKDIWTSCVGEGTIDEAPMAYKPMEEILECIKPTVDVVDRLIPMYNFKAD